MDSKKVKKTPGMSKTIIISNRLPVQLQISEGKIEAIPSVGGLATGMKSVHQDGESLWIGWSGLTMEEVPGALEPEIDAALAHHGCSKVRLSQKEVAGFYFGFSNRTIWPLFHYFMEYSEFDLANWKVYEAVNRKFAEALPAHAGSQDGPGETTESLHWFLFAYPLPLL
jgi:trehalose 6-phosphate synthase/phosphatase